MFVAVNTFIHQAVACPFFFEFTISVIMIVTKKKKKEESCWDEIACKVYTVDYLKKYYLFSFWPKLSYLDQCLNAH